MNTLGSSIKGQIKLFTSGIYAFFMLPEKIWGAYSRHAVRTSVRPSLRSHFSTIPGPNFMKVHIWTLWNNAQISRFLGLRLRLGKGGLNANMQFLLISYSDFVKISWNFMVILFIKSFNMCYCYFKLCIFWSWRSVMKKGFLAKFLFFFTNISFIFTQNFMKLHGYIVYLKFHHVPFFSLYVFQFDALSWKKWVSCKMS